MIRPYPTMKPSVRNPPRNRGYLSSSPPACSFKKYNVSRPGFHSKIHQVLHLPRKVTLEIPQVLHLPRKVTLELPQVPKCCACHEKSNRTLLYWTLPYSALLYLTLLYLTLLYSTLLYLTLPYLALLYLILLYLTLLYLTLLYLTLFST